MWDGDVASSDRVGGLTLVSVLMRNIKESIMIGDDIEVTVLSVDGAKVRLGIRAPSDIPVHRMEIYLEIQAQVRESASRPDDLPRVLPGQAS